MNRLVRVLAAVAIEGAVFVLVAATSTSWASRGVRVVTESSVSGVTSISTSTSSVSTSNSSTVSVVSCDGATCTVTLGGAGATVQVLDATISFDSIATGVAALHVDDQAVSLREGDTVAQGPVWLRCTRVTADDVTLVVTPR
jgi:hypothetical protein